LSDADLAQMIRNDAIDVLIDLSGHTNNNRLLAFARRPAPSQVNWLGFPSTTGMASMDYRITDAYCDPPGTTEHLNSEQLVRLPEIYMAWHPPEYTPDVGRFPRGKLDCHIRLVPQLLQNLTHHRSDLDAHPGRSAGFPAYAAW
jgi:hypothetical protein